MGADGQADLRYQIVTTVDNSGIQQHSAAVENDIQLNEVLRQKILAVVAAQDQLNKASTVNLTSSGHVTGDVLASGGAGLGDFVEQTEQFSVANEKQYLAIVKTIEAAQRKITVLEALGQSTVKLESEVQKLDAALSSESAISVAVAMEAKAIAEAEKQLAAAMNQGAEAARAEREAMERKNLRAQAATVKQAAQAEKEFADTESAAAESAIKETVAVVTLTEAIRILNQVQNGQFVNAAGKSGGWMTGSAGGMANAAKEANQLRYALMPLAADVMPGFGHIASSIAIFGLNPMIIAIAAVTEGLHFMQERMEGNVKAASQMGEIIDKQVDDFNRLHQAQLEATESARLYQVELERTAHAQQTGVELIDQYTQALQQQAGMREKVESAETRARLAKLDATEKDPVKKTVAEMDIRQREADRQNKEQDRLNDQEITQANQRRAVAQKEFDTTKQEAGAADAAYNKAKGDSDKMEALLKEREELQKKRDELVAKAIKGGTADKQQALIEGPALTDQIDRNKSDINKFFRGHPGQSEDAIRRAAQDAQATKTAADSKASEAASKMAEVVNGLEAVILRLREERAARDATYKADTIERAYKTLEQLTKQQDSLTKKTLQETEHGFTPTGDERTQAAELTAAIKMLQAYIQRLGPIPEVPPILTNAPPLPFPILPRTTPEPIPSFPAQPVIPVAPNPPDMVALNKQMQAYHQIISTGLSGLTAAMAQYQQENANKFAQLQKQIQSNN